MKKIFEGISNEISPLSSVQSDLKEKQSQIL